VLNFIFFVVISVNVQYVIISKGCDRILMIFLRKNVDVLRTNRIVFGEDPDSFVDLYH